LFMTLQECIEALRWGLFFRDGIELNSAVLAELAQEVIALNPQETGWSHAVKTAFQDWRAGRRDISPDDIVDERFSLEEVEPVVAHQERPHRIPANLDELAQKLTFISDESVEWLRTTRTLLDRKGQL